MAGRRHIDIALATDVIFYAPIAMALATATPRSAWAFVNPVYPERRQPRSHLHPHVDPLVAELTGSDKTILAVGDPERVEWNHGRGGVVAISTLIRSPFYFLFDPEAGPKATASIYLDSLKGSKLRWLNIFAPAGRQETGAATRTGTVLAHKLALDINTWLRAQGNSGLTARVFEAPPNSEERVSVMARRWSFRTSNKEGAAQQRFVFLSPSSRLWATYRTEYYSTRCVFCLTDVFGALGTNQFSSSYCMTALLTCESATADLQKGGFLGELLGSIEDWTAELRSDPDGAAAQFWKVAPDAATSFGFTNKDALADFFRSANSADAFGVQHFDPQSDNLVGAALWGAANPAGLKASRLIPFDATAYNLQTQMWPARRTSLKEDFFDELRADHHGTRLFDDAVPSVFETSSGGSLRRAVIAWLVVITWLGITLWVDEWSASWKVGLFSLIGFFSFVALIHTCKSALHTIVDVSGGRGGIRNIMRPWDAVFLVMNAITIPATLLLACTWAVRALSGMTTVRDGFSGELPVYVREPFAATAAVSLAFVAGLWIRWRDIVVSDRGESSVQVVNYSGKALWQIVKSWFNER